MQKHNRRKKLIIRSAFVTDWTSKEFKGPLYIYLGKQLEYTLLDSSFRNKSYQQLDNCLFYCKER